MPRLSARRHTGGSRAERKAMSNNVWIVANDEQEDQRVLAAFASQALAEKYAADLSGSVEVTEQPVHDRMERITLHMRDCYLDEDGAVRAGYTPHHSEEFWNFEAPDLID